MMLDTYATDSDTDLVAKSQISLKTLPIPVKGPAAVTFPFVIEVTESRQELEDCVNVRLDLVP